jgi:hypothetical protein
MMPHWRQKQRPQGIGVTGGSGDGENSRTTMTATTGDKDYNADWALHCQQRWLLAQC